MTEDVRHGDCTLVIKPVLHQKDSVGRTPESVLEEAVGLARAIALEVVAAETVRLAHPSPSHLLGSGTVERLAALVAQHNIPLVIIDHPLSPVQQRNLERDLKAKVIDRTGLILEIFGERARTREGQLQVELAALSYQRSRLVRSWTHLERQRGGFGFLGGPGESQLEIDRRLIDTRLDKIKDELDDVRRTRGLQRNARRRHETPTVALVGYTNAGKSTLFNRLTDAGVLAQNMLFATLDPTMRALALPSGRQAVLSDTVGFIADLPHQLVESFRATLEEVQEADVILHIRDVAHPESRAQQADVEKILAELGINPDDPRLIEVLNKADLLDPEERDWFTAYAARSSIEATKAVTAMDIHPQARGGSVVVSAMTGEGIDHLLALVDQALARHTKIIELDVPLTDGAALAWLYAHGRVLAREDRDDKAQLKMLLDEANLGRFQQKFLKQD